MDPAKCSAGNSWITTVGPDGTAAVSGAEPFRGDDRVERWQRRIAHERRTDGLWVPCVPCGYQQDHRSHGCNPATSGADLKGIGAALLRVGETRGETGTAWFASPNEDLPEASPVTVWDPDQRMAANQGHGSGWARIGRRHWGCWGAADGSCGDGSSGAAMPLSAVSASTTKRPSKRP